MSNATCKTCPALEIVGKIQGSAIQVEAFECWLYPVATRTGPDRWCMEHPDRKLPDVHELAARAMAAVIHTDDGQYSRPKEVASDAYSIADAMLAEAKRRQGGGA